jgi:PAS domain S-box-containing protein
MKDAFYNEIIPEHGFNQELDRKQWLEALKTSEFMLEEAKKATSRFVSLFNNMDHGFCIIEVIFNRDNRAIDYIFLENNPAFERLTGLTEVKGRSIRSILPQVGDCWFERFGDVVKTRQSLRFEGTILNGKRELWYDVNAFPIDDPQDNHVAVLFNNITNRKKRAEHFRTLLEQKVIERTAELQESRDFIKHITDTTPDILYILDLSQRRISYISKSVSSLGYTPEEIYSMGRNVFKDMVHPDDYEERINNILLMTSFRGEEVRGTEFRVKDKSGKWHWVNNRTTLFKTGEDNRPLEILGIALDITSRKETEAAYYKERDRSRELKRLNDVMDTFVYSAAHDLKAPISNLILLTNTIESTDDIDMKLDLQKKYNPIIEILNKTISGMINVLSIEKNSDAGVKRIYFSDAIVQIKAELNHKIMEADATIACSFRYCRSIVYNESYLMSIFRNMLTNSLKYRSDFRKPVIMIKSEKVDEEIILTFTDNGIGIDLQRYGDDLFKPFKRFGSKSEGSGIGLHLVKSIVTKNGGHIEVTSAPCEGTAFKIFLVEYK